MAYEQRNAAVPLQQVPARPDFFQNNPYYQPPNTNTNQINSGMPTLRQPSQNERFSGSEPKNSYYKEPQITYSSPPISDQHNGRILPPVENPQNANHATNYYSQTVAEPSDTTEVNIRAIVQRVIAEVNKDTTIRQSTSNQELEQIVRRILNEQYQSSNVPKVSSSTPTKLRQYEQSYPQSLPSNGVLNSYSNRVSKEPQQENNHLKSEQLLPTNQCFQNGQCDTATRVVAIATANSLIRPMDIRQTVNAMSYTSV